MKRVEPVKRKSGEADVVVDVKSLNVEDVSDWMNKLKLCVFQKDLGACN
jgi:hypothetical protein